MVTKAVLIKRSHCCCKWSISFQDLCSAHTLDSLQLLHGILLLWQDLVQDSFAWLLAVNREHTKSCVAAAFAGPLQRDQHAKAAKPVKRRKKAEQPSADSLKTLLALMLKVDDQAAAWQEWAADSLSATPPYQIRPAHLNFQQLSQLTSAQQPALQFLHQHKVVDTDAWQELQLTVRQLTSGATQSSAPSDAAQPSMSGGTVTSTQQLFAVLAQVLCWSLVPRMQVCKAVHANLASSAKHLYLASTAMGCLCNHYFGC